MFLNGDLEHLAGRRTVNVAALFKDLLAPKLSGKPREYARFNRGKISYQEFAADLRNKSGAYQLRQRVRHIFVEKLHAVKVAGTNKRARLCQICEVVLRQVLHLNDASCPATGTIGSVELKHTSRATVSTDCFFHRA